LFSSRAASRIDKNAQIIIIERRDYDMFSPCGIPYAIEGKVTDFEDLKHTVPTTRNLNKFLKHEATSINIKEKRVEVKNLGTGELFWLDYDSLILATGGRPKILPIPGAKQLLGRGVYLVSTPEEGEALREAALKSKQVLVVGGGAIGLEIALALRHLGLEVSVTKRRPEILPDNLDPDMGELIASYLKSQGVNVLFGKGIDRINGTDRVESVVIEGETIPCDIVVMAVGVDPESKLAVDAGIATDRAAIITDERMQTNVKDIYAVGDNCLTFSGINKEPISVTLATTAFRQAIVAGANAAGGEMVYNGAFGTFVSYIGNLEISCTGYSKRIAEGHGLKVVSGKANMSIKPKWMPDSKEISVKVIADAETGRILGGQAIGEKGTDWRINIIALAIKQRMTLQELSIIELAYCPAVSDLYDPLLVAVDAALRRLEAYARERSNLLQREVRVPERDLIRTRVSQ
jgi:NADPH-dependent 2,4-dienoyl-CoA reductase/sulfur reductase-like enzyme